MKYLTDDELNIAICAWRGWTNLRHSQKTGILWGVPPGSIIYKDVTDIPSHITGPEALGNMHEAEKGLTSLKQRTEYITILCGLVGDVDTWEIATATARHRAVALLRVVKPELFLP